MKPGIYLWALLLVASLSSTALAQFTGERALYLSGNQTLQGVIYRPKGDGPFPAVVFSQHAVKPFNQTEALNPFPQLAQALVSKGYILFIPGRHSPSENGPKEEKKGDGSLMIKNYQTHAENLLAAITWIKAQHDVDDKRISIIGEIGGAVSTLFAVNKGIDVRAIVLFSPGSQGMMQSYDLKVKLMDAVQASAAPIFLIQCENDFSLLPKTTLGPILMRKKGFNQVKVYPPYGDKWETAQRFAQEGFAVWQRDVLPFLKSAMN